jgi:hypothetical protein
VFRLAGTAVPISLQAESVACRTLFQQTDGAHKSRAV